MDGVSDVVAMADTTTTVCHGNGAEWCGANACLLQRGKPSVIKVKVTIDLDVLQAIANTAQKSPKLMQTAYDRNTRRLRSRIVERLAAEPGTPQYPIRWKSDKQRRYVMAKLREEGNLPYQRTHALSEGWKAVVEQDGSGGIMTVTNPSPIARYVQGDDAQPFHLDTGWKQVGDVISDARVEAEEVLIQTWFTVTDGGVFR